MKRIIALVLAGVMLYSLPVLAATSPSSSSVSKKEKKETSSPAEAVVATVSDSSEVSADVEAAAAANNQSVAEYANNAVSSLPGIANVTPMAPDAVMINGAASRAIRLAKPGHAVVSTAKTHADNLGGMLMNVVSIKSGARFQTAQINMLAMGVRAGQNIKVYQIVGGEPVELEVLEIREDHVVFNITEPGIVMFVLF